MSKKRECAECSREGDRSCPTCHEPLCDLHDSWHCKKPEHNWKRMALDAGLFLASVQIAGRFDQAESEWCNRVLRPINEALAQQATERKE